ncbi:hypothetical protein [Cellulomonas sp. C5510]|uniref:hypothetical protein n=1 Tax=Cellulomonas sp. C5510 TaxID=2871170 RepID=UPI001C94FB1F|nr:hypothetical protein [Cellulomonas sp. C5510]QZN85608.1 hypothetical protein K5O09_18065 [Cellulomonas sp. C5510]
MASARTRLVLSIGAVAGVGALVTAATFTDFANLNLGDGTDGGGIGSGRFNIQVVGTDGAGMPVPGTWQEANLPEGVDIAVPGAGSITPGGTIEVDLPYRNASTSLGADIDLWLKEVPGRTSTPAYLDALRFTILDGAGVPLVSDVTFDELDASSAAEKISLTDALTGSELAAGAEDSITVQVSLADYDADNSSGDADGLTNDVLNGGVAYVQLHWDAVSTAD